MLSVDLQSCK